MRHMLEERQALTVFQLLIWLLPRNRACNLHLHWS